MKPSRRVLTAFTVALAFALTAAAQQSQRWTEAQANAWYAKQPWLVGANYVPSKIGRAHV